MDGFSLLLLLLGSAHLHGDEGHDLGLDLFNLDHHLGHHLVHLDLVVDVELGQGEESDPRKDDEGEGVEPGADVGQEPKAEAELDGVNHALDEEEPAELGQDGVEGGGEAGGHGGDGVGGQGQGQGGHLGIREAHTINHSNISSFSSGGRSYLKSYPAAFA